MKESGLEVKYPQVGMESVPLFWDRRNGAGWREISRRSPAVPGKDTTSVSARREQ